MWSASSDIFPANRLGNVLQEQCYKVKSGNNFMWSMIYYVLIKACDNHIIQVVKEILAGLDISLGWSH